MQPLIPLSVTFLTILPIRKSIPFVYRAERNATIEYCDDRARALSYRNEQEHEHERAARTKPSTEVAGRRRLT
jgi:hypothetical protein